MNNISSTIINDSHSLPLNFNHPLYFIKSLLDETTYEKLLLISNILDSESLTNISDLVSNSDNAEFTANEIITRLTAAKMHIDTRLFGLPQKTINNIAVHVKEVICMIVKNCSKKDLSIDGQFILNELYSIHNNSANFSHEIPDIRNERFFSKNTKIKVDNLMCQYWWANTLKKTILLNNEYISLAIGLISADEQVHATNKAVIFKKEKDKKNTAFKNKSLLTCKKSGNVIKLKNLQSADKQKYTEFICKAQGITALAKQKDLSASLITFTAPPEFHATPLDGKHSSWDGSSPKNTIDYLSSLWNKFNKRLHKTNLYKKNSFYSIKAIEPGHDGTPHIHVLIYYPDSVKELLKSHLCNLFNVALINDQSNQVNWKDIDENDESIAFYLCKGFSLSDKNTHRKRIAAYFNIWGINSISFTGLPKQHTALWNEFRKNKKTTIANPIDKKIRDYAVSNDFCGFVDCLEKKENGIHILYKQNKSSSGSLYKKVVGITSDDRTYIRPVLYEFSIENNTTPTEPSDEFIICRIIGLVEGGKKYFNLSCSNQLKRSSSITTKPNNSFVVNSIIGTSSGIRIYSKPDLLEYPIVTVDLKKTLNKPLVKITSNKSRKEYEEIFEKKNVKSNYLIDYCHQYLSIVKQKYSSIRNFFQNKLQI